jgi:Cof subfamily protein (haloacid dehalogenase superfamily)
MTIRAICTDIDGTLLDSRRELSDKTISVIRGLQDRIPVILASSRMPSAMRHLQEQLGIMHHPLICYNGGYVIHFPNGNSSATVYDTVRIPSNLGSSIVGLARGTDIHISLYHEDEWIAPQVDQWTDREQRITKVNAKIGDIAGVLKQWQANSLGAHKLMCMGPENEINVMEQQLQASFGSEIHIYRSRPTYLELAPKSISKASALELVLKTHYGLELNDVLAFGDNYNDIDMLQQVGLGIAVSNARDEVKAVAREITIKSTEDGVALAIEKYCF